MPEYYQQMNLSLDIRLIRGIRVQKKYCYEHTY